jgi:glycosyltransferase involved in cell wall biosynthesis
MKVLFVTQQVIPHEGGLSTHLLDLMAGLRRQGHDVRLVHGGLTSISRWLRLLHAGLALGRGDRYRAWHIGAALGNLQRLVRGQLTTFDPELVHCHDPLAGFAVSRACHNRPVPVVETVHGPMLYEFQQVSGAGSQPRTEGLILRCEQTALAAATQLIAVDSGQAEILRSDYGVEAERVTVIFNSVNVDEVRVWARRDTALPCDAPFFLVPRRLWPKTGVQFAIEALAHVPRRAVRLIIAGQGPLRAELERRTVALGLTERVHFVGSVPRPQLLPLFARAVGVLVPSVPCTGVVEATSLAVMEAMACGSVAIASGIGGLAELIQDGETGLLVPPADAKALAQAMTSVLDDTALRTRLLDTATRKVETEYSTEAWLARILAVYQRAMSRTSVVRGSVAAS